MNSFQTQVDNRVVTLAWQTGSEANNAAFKIWQGELLPNKTTCTTHIDDYKPQTVKVLSTVDSQGTKVEGNNYSHTEEVAPGTYCYAIEDIEYDEVNSSRADRFHFPDDNQPVVVH